MILPRSRIFSSELFRHFCVLFDLPTGLFTTPNYSLFSRGRAQDAEPGRTLIYCNFGALFRPILNLMKLSWLTALLTTSSRIQERAPIPHPLLFILRARLPLKSCAKSTFSLLLMSILLLSMLLMAVKLQGQFASSGRAKQCFSTTCVVRVWPKE